MSDIIETLNEYNELWASALTSVSAGDAITFSGQGKKLLSISADGVMTIGEGMSADDATQEAAQMLIKHFAMAYVREIAELRAEIARLKADDEDREYGYPKLSPEELLEAQRAKNAAMRGMLDSLPPEDVDA